MGEVLGIAQTGGKDSATDYRPYLDRTGGGYSAGWSSEFALHKASKRVLGALGRKAGIGGGGRGGGEAPLPLNIIFCMLKFFPRIAFNTLWFFITPSFSLPAFLSAAHCLCPVPIFQHLCQDPNPSDCFRSLSLYSSTLVS
jgi:hypothetical protein